MDDREMVEQYVNRLKKNITPQGALTSDELEIVCRD